MSTQYYRLVLGPHYISSTSWQMPLITLPSTTMASRTSYTTWMIFLLVQPAFHPSHARVQFETLLRVFKRLGIPLAEGPDKICPPSTVLTFFGIEFDTIKGEFRLPSTKLREVKCQVTSWSSRSHCSKRELLSLAGLLFCAKVVLPGRTFVRRLFDAATSMPHIDSQTRLPPPPPPRSNG